MVLTACPTGNSTSDFLRDRRDYIFSPNQQFKEGESWNFLYRILKSVSKSVHNSKAH